MKRVTCRTVTAVVFFMVMFAVGCASTKTVAGDADAPGNPIAEAPEAPTPGSDSSESEIAPEDRNQDANDTEPQPYIPAGAPGSADAYRDLIAQLEQQVPAELRNDVPWPDTRNPDPIVAQTEIFDLWIWMSSNYPNPRLVEVMAAPRSPSRSEVVTVFAEIDDENVLRVRSGYEAFDHQVVTFESAGLPAWLSTGVPDDAVVVYYTDQSGPVQVIDRDTGDFIESQPGVGARSWLSIMVPTDVGWLLFRDHLIEPTNSDLPIPKPAPEADTQPRKPEL